MESYLQNKVDRELQINSNILKGTVDVDLLLNYLKNLVKAPDYNETYNVLVDIREADMPDFYVRINEFIQFFCNTSNEINWNRKCAIITSNPQQVVLSKLLEYEMDKLSSYLKINVFSTKEAALYWLKE